MNWEWSISHKTPATMRTVLLIGGPRDGARTLACAAVDPKELLKDACIAGHLDDGSDYLYSIIGQCQNGELLAVHI